MIDKGFKTKGEIIGAVAVLVVAFFGYGFLAKANHWWPHDRNLGTSTTGWQTYRNDEYGFEFQYPAGYEAWNTAKLPNPNNLNYLFDLHVNKDISLPLMNIFVHANTSINDRVAKLQETVRYDNKEGRLKILSDEKVTIDNHPARRLQLKGEGTYFESLPPVNVGYIFVEDNNLIFTLYWPEQAENDQLREQLISSFKFTK